MDEQQLFYAVGMAGETPVVLASHASEEEALRLGEEAARGAGQGGVRLVRAVPAEGEDDALQQYAYGMDGAQELTLAPPPSTGG